jgi:PAS domain S-box-containing protein
METGAISLSPRSAWQLATRYVVALVCVALALFIRWLLGPFLGNNLALLTIYGGVAFAVWFGGWRPAALASIVGYLAANYLFVPPRHTFTLNSIVLAGLVGYTLSCAVIIYLGENMKRAMRHAEDEIKKREVREQELGEQARLLELSSDAIIVRDADDRVVYWNSGAEDIYGYSRDEAIGKVTLDLLKTIHPVPLPRLLELLRRDGRWEGELVHTRRDGTQITTFSRWALDRDQQGNIKSILETNNDISVQLEPILCRPGNLMLPIASGNQLLPISRIVHFAIEGRYAFATLGIL